MTLRSLATQFGASIERSRTGCRRCNAPDQGHLRSFPLWRVGIKARHDPPNRHSARPACNSPVRRRLVHLWKCATARSNGPAVLRQLPDAGWVAAYNSRWRATYRTAGRFWRTGPALCDFRWMRGPHAPALVLCRRKWIQHVRLGVLNPNRYFLPHLRAQSIAITVCAAR